MDKYIGILKAIWVGEHGAKIYLLLLEQGEKSIADITKLLDMHRVEIYRQLPYLLESGLVLEVNRGKRKNYIAAHPHTIQDIHSAQNAEQESNIEKLVEQFSTQDNKPRVIYREWKKWVAAVFSDIVHTLEAWEVFYRVSSEKDVAIASSYLPKDYRSKRDAKQLERYVIMSDSGAKQKLPRLERELITIPPEFDDFADNVSLTLYGNKIAYIDFTTETSIIIEHKALADFHQKMFRMLYVSLRN